jgi:hypothetical protein
MGADKSKQKWDGGSMRIELDGVRHFVAGGQINGIVYLDLNKKFEAYSLVVKLEGKDEN